MRKVDRPGIENGVLFLVGGSERELRQTETRPGISGSEIGQPEVVPGRPGKRCGNRRPGNSRVGCEHIGDNPLSGWPVLEEISEGIPWPFDQVSHLVAAEVQRFVTAA